MAVKELGLSATDAQIQVIGKKMAAKYREAYGKEPSKHKQFVKGKYYVPVNSYTESRIERCLRRRSTKFFVRPDS